MTPAVVTNVLKGKVSGNSSVNVNVFCMNLNIYHLFMSIF